MKSKLQLSALSAVFITIGLFYIFVHDNHASGEAEPQAAVELIEPAHGQALQSTSCRGCHQDIFEQWSHSHHALANTIIDQDSVDRAFVPEKSLTVSGQLSTFRKSEKGIEILTKGKSGDSESFFPTMILGHTPLRQYLVPFPRGRWQVTEAAWDVEKEEWFNVYGEQNRQPHEWGFWTNRGMNWNAQCATCHMTDFEKNYDFESDSYSSTWIESGVGCIQCHGKLEKCPEQLSDFAINHADRHSDTVLDNCASCHSRREELVEGFAPGDRYDDYHRLQLPNREGLYYPDGQIRDEVFVYASFKMSKMGQAGVSCQHCHDPHSLTLHAPIENNALCMTCHGGSQTLGAKTIIPTEHSHHSDGSTGNRCVECHMTHTTYMERDPRRDHGFIIPDPLLTKTMGIPNACNKCHTEETVDWAIEHTDKWYGSKMDRPERERSAAIHAAFLGKANNSETLLDLYEKESNPIWKATLLDLATRQARSPRIYSILEEAINEKNNALTAVATQALAAYPDAGTLLTSLLKNEFRSIRIAAALALNGKFEGHEAVKKELDDYIDFHSDQPSGLSQKAQLTFQAGKLEETEKLFLTIIDWDGQSPGSYETIAYFYNAIGKKQQAVDSFLKAIEVAPANATLVFNLALLYAEIGQTQSALAQLKKAVDIDPSFAQAWYNLGLLQAQMKEPYSAIDSLLKAEAIDLNNASYPYARATIHLQMGKRDEAIAPIKKALKRQATHPPSNALLNRLLSPR